MAWPLRKRPDCRYRRNPRPPRHMQWGPRVFDGYSACPTYRDKLRYDEWGQLTNPELGHYDLKEQDDTNLSR